MGGFTDRYRLDLERVGRVGGIGPGWKGCQGRNSVFMTIKEGLNINYLVHSIEKVKTYFTNREGRIRKDEE